MGSVCRPRVELVKTVDERQQKMEGRRDAGEMEKEKGRLGGWMDRLEFIGAEFTRLVWDDSRTLSSAGIHSTVHHESSQLCSCSPSATASETREDNHYEQG